MKKKLNTDNRGFTILETMIAMAFFSIALLGAGALYIKSSQVNTSGNIISSANFLAKSTLETYKNMELTDPLLNTATPTTVVGLDEFGQHGGIYTRTVAVDSINGGKARQVTITVTWPGRANRSSDAITIVSNLRGGGL